MTQRISSPHTKPGHATGRQTRSESIPMHKAAAVPYPTSTRCLDSRRKRNRQASAGERVVRGRRAEQSLRISPKTQNQTQLPPPPPQSPPHGTHTPQSGRWCWAGPLRCSGTLRGAQWGPEEPPLHCPGRSEAPLPPMSPQRRRETRKTSTWVYASDAHGLLVQATGQLERQV